MYNDGVITTEFTGYYDAEEGEFVSPSAHQNLIIKFPTFYLSADDGDITDSGVTITSETGDAEDITIGNATAKVLTATMLNPNGLMESLTWGDGAVYIGVATASEAYESTAEVYAKKEAAEYVFTASQIVPPAGTAIGYEGEPTAIVVNDDGTAWFYTDTTVYYFNGSAVAEATQSDAFTLHKYQSLSGVGILLDANGIPLATWKDGESNSFTYIPMGVYDFSGVDAFGITFGVEAYDRMTLFDADATDWVASLDFTTPKTLTTILSELMTEMGFSGNYTVSASAVNGSLSYSENPITAYAVAYRQVLRWIAEAMGCNVRMSRTGGVELYTFDSTSVQTITPYTIISNTRTKARYTVPQITEVVCYDTLGMNYASGSEGVPYYIAANPFLTGLDTSVTPLTNICTLLRGIPVYYPSTIGQMYADPRLDTGDFVTIQTTDGTATYVVPVMRQTLHWSGVCEASLVASGNQTRAVPSDLIDNNLATTVNGRKILEGVDAKRITVLDEQENILFNADTETDEVQIAGFTVRDSDLYVTGEEESADYPGRQESLSATVSHWAVDLMHDHWADVEGTATRYTNQGYFDADGISFTKNGSPFRTADVAPGLVSVAGEAGAAHMDAQDGEIQIYNNAQTLRAYVRPGGITLRDTTAGDIGAIELTITAGGPDVNGENSENDVSIPSNTLTELASFDVTPGVYLLTATVRFGANASGYRQIALRYGTTSSASTNMSRELQNWAAAASGVRTCICVCAAQAFTQNRTIHLYAYQNSGSSLASNWAYHFTRLA